MSKIEDKIGLSDTNKKRLERTRELVKNRWGNARQLPYPPHDQSHCEKIESILSELLLLDDEKGREAINTFTDDEKFLLLAAVWLHDIGMCPNLNMLPSPADEELRRTHHERSAQFIKIEPELQEILTARDRDRLSTICFLHRKSERIPDKLYDKIRLIIAYIRLADALHIPDRAPLSQLRTFLAYGMDPVSKYHWFKSFYVIYAGPSRKEGQKLVVQFKKPLNWNGDAEKDLTPLVDIINTELRDELDSVKDILQTGKLKYDLPSYTDEEAEFDETYLSDDETADLKELLGIIELFNPTISPNSGKVIDIVLNQIERCVTIEPEKAEEGIRSLQMYSDNTTLVPLLKERPCHAYLWNVHDELQEKFRELDNQLSATNWSNKAAEIRIRWLSEIQRMVRALKWWRKELERKLPQEVSKAEIISKNDSLLLYGYSSSVILALNALDDDAKKNIKVFVCECATKTKHRYDNRLIYCDGLQYISELKKIGIEKIYCVPDSCASNLFLPYSDEEVKEKKQRKKVREKVNKVLFGANGIDKETGEVFHGLGHLAIADMAEVYNIPVYVIAEGLKIRKRLLKTPVNQRKDPWYPTDVKFDEIVKDRDINFYNPREDVVLRDKITEIITEKGRYNTKLSLTELDGISAKIRDVVTEYRKRYEIKTNE